MLLQNGSLKLDFVNGIADSGKGILLQIRFTPRSSRRGFLGVENNWLKVAVNAPPDKGAANRELVELISKNLKVPKRDVAILQGSAKRRKLVEIRGISREYFQEKINL